MVIENGKIADVRESVLYAQARAKMDRECASAGDECRIAMEALADLLGARIKNDTEACGKILCEEKTLQGAYEIMRKTVEERVKPKRGVLSCGCMSDEEALELTLAYYGITQQTPREQEEKQAQENDVKSIFDFL